MNALKKKQLKLKRFAKSALFNFKRTNIYILCASSNITAFGHSITERKAIELTNKTVTFRRCLAIDVNLIYAVIVSMQSAIIVISCGTVGTDSMCCPVGSVMFIIYILFFFFVPNDDLCCGVFFF